MRYVVGLLFSEDRSNMAVVRKLTPSWQHGLLNGPGGKIEGDETPYAAMRREFLEETGVAISAWKPVVVLSSPRFEVHFFAAFSDHVYRVKTMEAEEIMCLPVERVLGQEQLIPGLRTQITIALDESGIAKPVMIDAVLKGG